ncbi:MAG: 6,7-dimethyl-8-ribityllumazine synthase [Bacteroidetes bacterium]|nr:MAG: 6,7-dimethyl-8-ribityllumazine synthase [Bacteroidota bacterium]
MATALKNLSDYDPSKIPSAENWSFGIVVAEWNEEITSALCEGAVSTLVANGAKRENIKIHAVPGSFELPLGARWLADHSDADAVICLGCVIQGETRHFEFICNSVAQGLIDLSISCSKPFIFGVLTTDNIDQARERSGGKHGNKGDEAAITAIKMLALKKRLV